MDVLTCISTCAEKAKWWPTLTWIGALLIPSIITALTKYPKTTGIVSFLQEVVDRASILTHADAPGTLKLPIARSPSPGRR